jgi:hypothetical protein
MFNDEACSGYPCPRFVRGAIDPETEMVQCARCLAMWFVIDEDPIEDSNA